MAAVMTVAPETVVQTGNGASPYVMKWTPEPAALRHVVNMLKESTTGSSAVHDTIYRQLESYATNSDFNNYLAHILARGCTVSVQQDPPHSASNVAEAQQQPMQQLIADPRQAQTVRQVAGLLLKNNIRLLYTNLPQERQVFINGELLHAIGDGLRVVRSSVAICVAAIVERTGPSSWPELCPTLIRYLDSGEEAPVDGALTVLCRLAEDIPHILDQEPSSPLDAVVPKVINFCSHPNDKMRAMALQIINHFLLVMPPILHTCIDAYCQALFRIAEDTTIDVRKRVCTAICLMLQSKPEALAPYMHNIIEYMLVSSRHENEHVAVEACEFWSVYADSTFAKEGLREYIPRIVPLLLENMVYSESDRVRLGSSEEQDDMVPDRPEDIRPRFHQPRFRDTSANQEPTGSMSNHSASAQSAAHSNNDPFERPAHSVSELLSTNSFVSTTIANNLSEAKHSLSSGSDANAFSSAGRDSNSGPSNIGSNIGVLDRFRSGHGDSSLAGKVMENGSTFGGSPEVGPISSNMFSADGAQYHASQSDSDDDDDDDDGNMWAEDDSEWNVRKSSATALDALSSVLSDEVLAVVLPLIQEKLMNTAWEHREVGVLALGAIAEGCYQGMENHMPTVFPFLISFLSDSHYLVRTITAWTLSQYARWAIHSRDDASFKQLLGSLLERMLDRNKMVQKATCSAFASVAEEAGILLCGYLGPILRAMITAFGRYQAKNLVVLYDAISTLADAVGAELGEAEHINILMPPLINKWNSLADTDAEILTLLDCLTGVFRALGMQSHQYAPNVFARCVNIIDAVYKIEATGERDPIHIEFLTCSLDLMCGLAEAIGPRIDPLVANSSNGAKPLLPLLCVAMKDKRQEVRQSAFALLGEFGRARLPALIPALHDYVRFAIGALNPEYMSVANNATWALGEVIMMAGFLPHNVPVDRDGIKRFLLEDALDSLIRVVNQTQLNRSLIENTAITLGRMGLVMPEPMAHRLGSFAQSVFSALRDIRDDVEKEQAFLGMNKLVKLNPGPIWGCFVYYVDAIASWYQCKPELEAEFASILSGFKNSIGDQWFAIYRSFPPGLQVMLKERFKI